ncbi:MAG: FAD-binding oxidoreductase [Verrucomicrobia bacterium]|nr:FAD-binding oxidoreductase [Verrucomicrobiota bacterium]
MKKIRFTSKKFIFSAAAILIAVLTLITGIKTYDLAAAPIKERDCDFVYPRQDNNTEPSINELTLDEAGVEIQQIGGVINDASCLNKTNVYGIIQIKTEEDVARALKFAREHELKITPAGKRHSMGGQSFSKGGLVLDMRGLNEVQVVEESLTMNVQSGASWKEIQAVLDPKGLAVKAMQSINIFTVGGTLSVNAHGIDHDPGQIGPTVRSMRVMLADGTIRRVSPTENRELFSAVLGGYGLTAVILDVELDIVKNDVYAWKTDYIDYKKFSAFYDESVVGKEDVRLMYARLSIAPGSYLTEIAVHRYVDPGFDADAKPLGDASIVWIKRLIFNLSKTGGLGRWIRWTAEKYIEPGYHNCVTRDDVLTGTSEEVCVASRNQKMNQSMEYLDTRIKDTNILNEYFIPQEYTTEFIDGLRTIVQETDVNLVNVTLRIVTRDELSALPYAKDDRIAYVLYFNQKLNEEDSKKLERATGKLIDLAISLNGTFYLPYQLYYSAEQLRAAYPEIDDFFALKRKYDPEERFSNAFYEKYGG